jgi:hypothetical protein
VKATSYIHKIKLVKYSRTVKRKVKCLKSLEKEPKNSLSKNDKRIQDQVIRKGKNISKYPPCVFVYAKSVGSWMPLGHIHIQSTQIIPLLLSIITGVAVSFNVVKPDSAIE